MTNMRDSTQIFNGLKPSTRRKHRLGSVGSVGSSSAGGPRIDSPQSLQSPIRTNRRIGMSSPGDDGSDDSGIRVDRGTYQHMFQDVINIKSMLVRLQRILQEDTETGGGDGGLGSQGDSPTKGEEGEEFGDLRRQVVLLCAELDERERRISRLEAEIEARTRCAQSPSQPQAQRLSVTRATQTERIRPLSTRQALFQSSPDNSSSSFVSCMNDKKTGGVGERVRRTQSR